MNMDSKDLVFVDCETSGLQYGWHEILEICCVVVNFKNYEVRYEIEQKIKPNHPERISLQAAEVNGYSTDAWEHAPRVDAVMPGIMDLVLQHQWVGHNAYFDINFVANCMDYNDLTYHNLSTIRPIDTLQIAKSLKIPVEDYKLDTLCDYYGISTQGRAHTARADVLRTIELYRHLLQI